MEKDYIEKILNTIAGNTRIDETELLMFRCRQFTNNRNEKTREKLMNILGLFLAHDSWDIKKRKESEMKACDNAMEALGELSKKEMVSIMQRVVDRYLEVNNYENDEIDDRFISSLAHLRLNYFMEKYMKNYLKYIYDHEHHLVRAIVMGMTDKYDSYYLQNEGNNYNKVKLYMKLKMYDRLEDVDSDMARFELLRLNPKKYIPIYTKEKRGKLLYSHLMDLDDKDIFKYYRNCPLEEVREYFKGNDTETVFDKDGKFIPENYEELSLSSRQTIAEKAAEIGNKEAIEHIANSTGFKTMFAKVHLFDKLLEKFLNE